MSVLLGLCAAVLIGTSDLLGARSSGRTTALQTTTVAFGGGALVTAVVSPLLGSASPTDHALGALSGVAAFAALTTLWLGYARSSIGVAAPVAAVVSAVGPVLFEAGTGRGPGVIGWVGVVIGVAALLLTSYAPGSRDPISGIVLGSVAGICFGTMFLVAASTDEASATWPVVGQRSVALLLALFTSAVTRRPPVARDAAAVGWAFAAGAAGAAGVAAVVVGGQRGPVAPVLVAASMYPVVAVALARVVLDEPLSRRQAVGLAAAVVGVALVTIG